MTALTIIILIVVLVILGLLLLLRYELFRRLHAPFGDDGPGGGSGAPGHGTGDGPPGAGEGGASAPTIPDTISPAGIASLLVPRLAGIPADGSAPVARSPDKVIWVDRGDEVLVHLDSLETAIVGQTVLVSLDLETDQTGRTPLVVAFSLAQTDEAGMVAATDEYARGNGLLASRWGASVQGAAWSALLSLANDHASERALAPRGLTVAGGQLHLVAGPPLQIA